MLAQTALTTGRPVLSAVGLVAEVAADSRPVAVALARAGIMALGAVVALAVGRSTRGLVAGAGVVLLGSFLAPVAGHPWTADPRALAVAADALHLASASVWLGLLVALAASARAAPRPPVAAVRAVSGAALVASAVLLVTGTTSAWLLLGSLDALLRTASGQLVILKVIGFAALAMLGWVNRTRLIPLLGRAVGVEAADRPEAALVGAGAGRTPAARRRRADGTRPTPPPDGRDRPRTGTTSAGPGPWVGCSSWCGSRWSSGPWCSWPPPRWSTSRRVATSWPSRTRPPRRSTGRRCCSRWSRPRPGPTRSTSTSPTPPATRRRSMPSRCRPAGTASRPGSSSVEQISPDHAVAYGVSLPTPGTWDLDVTTVRVGVPRQFRFEVPVT